MCKVLKRSTEDVRGADFTKYALLVIIQISYLKNYKETLFVCVEVLRPSQPNGAMSSAVSLPNHTFTGQA